MRTLLLLLATALGAGCNFSTGPTATTPGAQSTTNLTWANSPAEAYKQYQNTLSRAASVEEIAPYLDAPKRQQLTSMPRQAQTDALQAMQRSAAPNPYISNEKQNGNYATLDVLAADQRRAKVTMVREEGLWRVQHEDWAHPDVAAPPPAPLPPAPLPPRP
jgi:hypothetical protein